MYLSSDLQNELYMFCRQYSVKESEALKTKIIALYKKLERFLNNEKFDAALRKELSEFKKDYMHVLNIRKTDISQTDHGIVIAGINF